MNIEFITEVKEAPSTKLNWSILRHLPNIQFKENPSKVADVYLFMSYDPQIKLAKKKNNNAIIGIIDPRPGSEEDLREADFFLANGVEMVNFFAESNANAFIYPIYPDNELKNQVVHETKETFQIAYHGNKVHLELMEDTVCHAIERISKVKPVRLKCFYNVESLGKWEWKPKSKNIMVDHIQWTENGYLTAFDQSHVGIVPNLIPFKPIKSDHDNLLEENKKAFDSDLFFRFKPTSNLGRIVVFAQLGIPVIADMYPSSTEIITHGFSGYIATNRDSWFNYFKKLLDSDDERILMGKRLQEKFVNQYHWKKKNQELISFLETNLQMKNKSKSGFRRLFS